MPISPCSFGSRSFDTVTSESDSQRMRRWWRLQAFISTLAGQKRQLARQQVSELTTAPGTTADRTDTRPPDGGIGADPFCYHFLESGRAIVFEWCRATRAGIAIIPRRATVRC